MRKVSIAERTLDSSAGADYSQGGAYLTDALTETGETATCACLGGATGMRWEPVGG
jgi:hypothetical protein